MSSLRSSQLEIDKKKMINHLNMSYFITVARELNITKASEKLYISQQALSNHISSLEKEMGVKLFERGNTLRLTYAGAVFYKYALEMEDWYHRLCQEMGDIRNEVQGEIAIGISHTRGRFILPKILPAFIEKYPKVQVRVLEGNTEELAAALINGEIDIVIGQPTPGLNEIIYEQLLEEEIVLAVADQLLVRYGLDSEEVRCVLEQDGRLSILKDIPFLLNKRGNATRTAADKIFRQEGMIPHILIETENIETLGEMCKNAIGAAFYPVRLLEKPMETYIVEYGMHLFKLNAEYTRIPFAIGYRKNKYISKVIREMIQMVKVKLQQ